jgi:hypothetical protein
VSPLVAEVPVPLKVVAPPAVPFEPCASTKVLDNANAVASAIVTNFMSFPFHVLEDKNPWAATRRYWCVTLLALTKHTGLVSSVYAETANLNDDGRMVIHLSSGDRPS